MRLVKFATEPDASPRVGLVDGERVVPLGQGPSLLSEILHDADPSARVRDLAEDASQRLPLASVRLLAPIDRQEVWGAGVTYERSKKAREEESERAATFYDLVYRAERPELFFKATPHRVAGPGEPIRVRATTDAELAARLLRDRNLLALPVVDDEERLLGIVTVDDAADLIEEGLEEDYLRLAGSSDAELMERRNALQIARLRIP